MRCLGVPCCVELKSESQSPGKVSKSPWCFEPNNRTEKVSKWWVELGRSPVDMLYPSLVLLVCVGTTQNRKCVNHQYSIN